MSAKSALTPEQVFGQRLQEARKDRGLTQQALAERLREDGREKIDRSTVNRLERGKKQVTLRDLFDVASALNVAPVHLITPLEDDVPLEIGGRVLPARRARAWIRGERLMRGADLPAFSRQVPDSELRAIIETVLAARTDRVTWALIDPAKREATVRELMDAIRNFTREEDDDG